MRRSIASSSHFGMKQLSEGFVRHVIASAKPGMAQFARTCPTPPWDGRRVKNGATTMSERPAPAALLDAVERYFALMYDNDVARFDSVFAPSAQLHGLRDGKLRILTTEDYRNIL